MVLEIECFDNNFKCMEGGEMNWKEKLESKSEDLLDQYNALWSELTATEGIADDKYEQWKKDIAAISAEREMISTEIKDKEALRVVLLAKKHRLQAAAQWSWEDMEHDAKGAINPDEWADQRTKIQMELAKTIDELKAIEQGIPQVASTTSQEDIDTLKDELASNAEGGANFEANIVKMNKELGIDTKDADDVAKAA